LNQYTFHINLYDLAFLGAMFIGLAFALVLWFAKRVTQAANRFLALALAVMVLWMGRILGIDIRLSTYIPHWSWLPMQFSLAIGPLIYFYVLKLTRTEYQFRLKDLLHFSPLLLELGAQAFEINEDVKCSCFSYTSLSTVEPCITIAGIYFCQRVSIWLL
jgi:putative ABC transport system permease protein